MLVVAGVVLLFAPRDLLPGLLVALAPLFVVLGILGWLFKLYYSLRS